MRLACIVTLQLAVLVVGPIGCASDEADPTTSDPSTLVARLLAAPETIELGGLTYELDTFLWRDFMPISPPDGKPLIALIRVIESGGQPIPTDVDAVYLWVIHEGRVWATPFSDENRPPQPKGQLERVARDGPKWGPHVSVEVVVELVDEEGEGHLLRASEQPIHRTD